jgi:hypothetical protein
VSRHDLAYLRFHHRPIFPKKPRHPGGAENCECLVISLVLPTTGSVRVQAVMDIQSYQYDNAAARWV